MQKHLHNPGITEQAKAVAMRDSHCSERVPSSRLTLCVINNDVGKYINAVFKAKDRRAEDTESTLKTSLFFLASTYALVNRLLLYLVAAN